MFKKISIELTEPVCGCASEDIKMSWYVVKYDAYTDLHLKCLCCGTTLVVPHDKFIAAFNYDSKPRSKKNYDLGSTELFRTKKESVDKAN